MESFREIAISKRKWWRYAYTRDGEVVVGKKRYRELRKLINALKNICRCKKVEPAPLEIQGDWKFVYFQRGDRHYICLEGCDFVGKFDEVFDSLKQYLKRESE